MSNIIGNDYCFKCKGQGFVETKGKNPDRPNMVYAEACDCPAGEAWSARAGEIASELREAGYPCLDITDMSDPDRQLAEGFNWFDRNSGHGHVIPRPDFYKNPTCGGPGACPVCDFDQRRLDELLEAGGN